VRYPGGKSKCVQKLINLIPPHRTYIESHLGGGAVLRFKAPAEASIGIDPEPAVISRFQGRFDSRYRFIIGTAEDFLDSYRFTGDEFLYADPPYWPAARRCLKSPYRFDYTPAQHVALLQVLLALPCKIMISGYANPTYDRILARWRRHDFPGTSHAGRRTETVWFNYEPAIVHDTRYLGSTFRERQGIKRKRARWTARFSRQPAAVQQAILGDLTRIFAKHSKSHGSASTKSGRRPAIAPKPTHVCQ
jgi:DNA adenine methylase